MERSALRVRRALSFYPLKAVGSVPGQKIGPETTDAAQGVLMMFMANIRRVILVVCVLGGACAATPPAHAQDAALPKTQAEFEKQIGLTADQKKKMDAVQKKYQPQLMAIGKKYQPEFVKMQKQMQDLQTKMQALNQKAQLEAKPLMEQAQKESNAILTPAQQSKIKAFQAQAKQQAAMQGGMMGGAPPR